MSEKGFLNLAVLIAIFALIVSAAVFFVTKNLQKPKPTSSPSPSTQQSTIKIGLKFDKPPVQIDPFGDRRGPYYHQIFMARSTDGLIFKKEGGMLFDKASVPDTVRLPNGRILLYSVDGAGRSNSGIMVALSDDGGKSWDSGSLQIKGYKGKNVSGTDPQIVLLPDETLRLYTIQTNWVQSAISEDRINFTQEEGKRFEYPQITDPDVVNINGKWFMYLSQGPRLIAASSDDGITFKFEKVIRQNGSVSKTVYVDVDFWRQFYCVPGGIKSSKTSDGLTFTEEPGFRLLPDQGKLICDPSPVHLGGQWLLFYKVSD